MQISFEPVRACSIAQTCPTLCYPMDCSVFPWNFPGKRLTFPTLGDLPDPGIEPTSLVSPALAGGFFTTAPPGKLAFELVSYKKVIPFPMNLIGTSVINQIILHAAAAAAASLQSCPTLCDPIDGYMWACFCTLFCSAHLLSIWSISVMMRRFTWIWGKFLFHNVIFFYCSMSENWLLYRMIDVVKI